MKTFLNDVNRFLLRRGLVTRGDRILVALSAGPDSAALLKFLVLLRKNWKLDLHAGHVNHGLRGRASDGDQAFARALCCKLGVPFCSFRASGAKLKRSGLSLEEAAREVRYAHLLGEARRLRAKLATAHTLDDQAETVLMRIIRGSGLKGLAAIPASRKERGVEIIRPFLCVTKAQVLDFLKQSKTAFRKDASNADPRFFRNRIRRSLIPSIERGYNAQFQKNLAELSDSASEAYDFYLQEAQKAFKSASRRNGKGITLAVSKLGRIHPALRSEVYFLALESLLGNRRTFTKPHIDAIDSLLTANADSRHAHHLPRNLRVSRVRGSICFTRVKG